MGTVRQAIEAISVHGSEPRARTVQMTRQLQHDDMMPVSIGRAVEHVTATQLAGLILAVSAAPKPADATRTALTWGRMTPNGAEVDWDTPPDRRPLMLIEALTGCIGMVWKEGGQGSMTNIVTQASFEITTTHPHAIVTLNGQRDEYLPIGGSVHLPGFHRPCLISGTTIRQIAMALYEGPHHSAVMNTQPRNNRDPYREPASVLTAPLAR